MNRVWINVSILLTWMFVPIAVWATEIPAFVQARHRAVLISYFKLHPNLAVGGDRLCKCDEDLAKHRIEDFDFQPYYAVGDMNDDGIEDFAVGLVDIQQAPASIPKLSLVIFHGPFQGRKVAKGIRVFSGYSMTRSHDVLSVFKARVENNKYRFGARLDLGPWPLFASDDGWRIQYNWKSRKYLVY